MQLPLTMFNFGEGARPAAATPPLRVTMSSCLSSDERCTQIRSTMLRGLPALEMEGRNDRPMAIACYGPSLRESLDLLRDPELDVFSVSGAHDLLLDAGITPYAHIESDPRAHKARFFTRPQRNIQYYIASVCHRDVFEALRGFDVRVWHVANSPEEDALIASYDPSAFTVLGGTSVGTRAICLGTALGRHQFSIFGMDCSFREDEQHAGPHPNPAEMVVRVTLPDGQKVLSSPQMLQNAQDFLSVVGQTPSCRYKVHGDGLLKKVLPHAHIARAS